MNEGNGKESRSFSSVSGVGNEAQGRGRTLVTIVELDLHTGQDTIPYCVKLLKSWGPWKYLFVSLSLRIRNVSFTQSRKESVLCRDEVSRIVCRISYLEI